MIRSISVATRAFAVPETMLVSFLAMALFASGAAAQTASTDIGTLDKPTAAKVFPSKQVIHPTQDAISRRVHFLATLTCTPLHRLTPVLSAHALVLATPFVSPAARR